jgi:long-chain fatty acid transport protein
MKEANSLFYKVALISAVTSCALYATNGDTLIGVGAKTRAMGGAGIAFSHGAESTLVNPALITQVKQTEISFGGTIFMPTIKTQIDPNSAGQKIKSDAKLSIIPEVAIVSQIKPNIYVGVGMYGTAGMGVDFRGNSALFDMETTLQLMQFAVPVAYRFNGFSIGISPILQYGSLDINYKMGTNTIGYGQKQDFGYGFSIGATYDFKNGFMVGAVYKSKIKMKYPKVLTTAATPFIAGITDTLEQPAEIGIGISYTYNNHSIALDYKKIKWSSAKGYKDFGWKDQNVFAVGYQYKQDNWALRVGYNRGSNPIKTGANPAIDMFNLLGFPATAKNHFTLGGSYEFSKNFSTDLTVVYSPKAKTSSNLGGMMGMTRVYNEHSELGITVQFNYKF